MNIFSKKKAIMFGWSGIKTKRALLISAILFASLISTFLNVPVVSELVLSFFLLGLIKISFDILNGVGGKFENLFSNLRLFLNFLGASILYGLIVVAGLVLFVVPGVIWAVRFQLFPFFVVEEKAGPVKALKESALRMQDLHIDIFLLDILLLLIALVIRVFSAFASFVSASITSFIVLFFSANSEFARSVAGIVSDLTVSIGWFSAFVMSVITLGYVYRRLLDNTWVAPDTEAKLSGKMTNSQETKTKEGLVTTEKLPVVKNEAVFSEENTKRVPEFVSFNDDDAWIHELPKRYYSEQKNKKKEEGIMVEVSIPESTPVLKPKPTIISTPKIKSDAKKIEQKKEVEIEPEKLLEEPERQEMIEEISDKPLIEDHYEDVPSKELEKLVGEELEREVVEEKIKEVEIKKVPPETEGKTESIEDLLGRFEEQA